LRIFDYSYVILVLIFLGGCVPALQGDISVLDKKVNQQRKEVRLVRQQQAELETRLDTLQSELQRINGAVDESKHYAQRASDDVIALSEGLTSGRGRYEQELYRLQEEIRTIKTLLGMKVGARSDVPAPNARETFLQMTTTTVSPTQSLVKVTGTPDPEELYNEAYSKLSTGDFRGSRDAFKKFLELFPQTEYSDNAQFWIGESYYRDKRYEEAIVEFDEVIKKYPQGNKLPDALLKQAFSFIALSDTNSAKLLLQKIIDRYPTSEQAEIARAKLKSLK
jgi:tol-pal system protein YbgF